MGSKAASQGSIYEREVPTSCDYLVIGSGSGGSAAAGRLAGNSDAQVVLLEAGGTHNRDDVRKPIGWVDLLESDANWGYETVPQEGTLGRVHIWKMGKVLGGSSSVNGMMYMRGAAWDYDAWAEMGNEGWDSETVFQYFRKMEDYPEGDPQTRGTGGPVKLLRVAENHPVITSFLSACEEKGWIRAGDFNGLEPEGFDVHQLNVRDGRRQSSAVAFLDPLADRDNLTVVTDATAQQIVLDDGRVAEVVFKQGEEIKRIRVDGEVVVSAGCIGSPQVLLLSGIGPKRDLEKLGIDVVLDLPAVGESLHDHIGVPVAFEATKALPESEHQAVEVGMYCKSDPSKPHYDIQVPVQNFPFVPPGTDSYAIKNGFTFYPGIMKPKSRGRISLRSSDPNDRPVIDPAYLKHPDDLALLMRALEVGREVGEAHAFDEWRRREAEPGPDITSAKDIEYYVRERAATYFHPVGGCKMGSGDDSVVDEQLKVHGVENMRVADASIMPEIISGNTNAPSMMIGWRAAEFVLSDAGVAAKSAT